MSTPTLEHPEVRDAGTRFEIHVDDSGSPAGFTVYRDTTAEDGTAERIFPHTVVGEEFSGHGLAGTLVAQALAETVEAGRRIVPVCPYVKSWLGKHPEYDAQVVAPEPRHLRALRG